MYPKKIASTSVPNELFSQAQKVLQDLSQSYYSANSLHLKKGILLALAAAAIGFGKEAKPFLTGTLLPFTIPKSPDGFHNGAFEVEMNHQCQKQIKRLIGTYSQCYC